MRASKRGIIGVVAVATVLTTSSVGALAAGGGGPKQAPPGNLTVTPSSFTAGSTGNNLTLRFTAKGATPAGGVLITFARANDWSPFQWTNKGVPGYVTLGKGTCTSDPIRYATSNASFIDVPNVRCTKSSQYLQLNYQNATVPTTPGPYTFNATDSATPTVTMPATVTVNPGPAKKLAFTTGPFSFTAGNTMGATTVAVEDQFNNIVTTSSALITITSSPLSGTLSKAASHGVATFSDLTGTLAGLSYPFVASSGSLTPASTFYNINPAPADHLAFDTQPSDTVVNGTMSPNVVVGEYDVYNNPASDVSPLFLSLGSDPRGGGGTVDSIGVPVVDGKATWTGLKLDTAAVGYTLVASDFGAALQVESDPFDVTLPIVRPASDAGTYWDGLFGATDVNLYQWIYWDAAGNPYIGPCDFPGPDGVCFAATNFVVSSAPDGSTQGYVWEQNSSDPRALSCGACIGPSAAAWYGNDFTITVTVPSGSTQLTMYLVDWDTTARAESITVDDGTGPQPVSVSAFHDGAYVSAPIDNTTTTVTIHLHSDAGANAVISGIFVD